MRETAAVYHTHNYIHIFYMSGLQFFWCSCMFLEESVWVLRWFVFLLVHFSLLGSTANKIAQGTKGRATALAFRRLADQYARLPAHEKDPRA
jgi:hypothetical protein